MEKYISKGVSDYRADWKRGGQKEGVSDPDGMNEHLLSGSDQENLDETGQLTLLEGRLRLLLKNGGGGDTAAQFHEINTRREKMGEGIYETPEHFNAGITTKKK